MHSKPARGRGVGFAAAGSRVRVTIMLTSDMFTPMADRPHGAGHHRLWQILLCVLAFLLAVLWANPTH